MVLEDHKNDKGHGVSTLHSGHSHPPSNKYLTDGLRQLKVTVLGDTWKYTEAQLQRTWKGPASCPSRPGPSAQRLHQPGLVLGQKGTLKGCSARQRQQGGFLVCRGIGLGSESYLVISISCHSPAQGSTRLPLPNPILDQATAMSTWHWETCHPGLCPFFPTLPSVEQPQKTGKG